ncbi:hypothetical protein GCM10017044_02830 [Kordiimonas sediminis]|uniref:Uncharacterized protein n=1 Tax=Kordiimonas sediminis TaxID=1735581 RepID=A0A919E487_9PROT|nr:hypothetical protein [Kordiimonas sediminis]GHF12325.1 hypothetical protein GCM10017044_02830 [Kordiimonas sediminis]
MILESRSIVFSHDEVLIALRPLLEMKGLTGEEIVEGLEIGLDDNDEVMLTICFDDSTDNIVLFSKEIGAAILNHCIDQGIPLPRGSYKELTTRGDMIAMIVRLESGQYKEDKEPAAEDAVAV